MSRLVAKAVAVAAALVAAAGSAVAAAAAAAGTCEGGQCATSINPEAVWARSILPHPIDAPIAKPLPRISVEELKLPGNEHFRRRTRPFLLTGAMEGWPAMYRWPVNKDKMGEDYLTRHFPEAVCDLYPYNMLKQGSHPYLTRFKEGLKAVMLPPHRYQDPPAQHEYACEGGCRYIHLQLTPEMWRKLEELGDMPGPTKRHPHTEGDDWWMRRCLTDPDVRDEYHIKTHWKIILIGTQGSGMFNHTDSLQTSSWHGHVQGQKWWYVCGRNVGPGPREGEDECFESVVQPGEVLYYGANWWHTTRNLENPSMTITGTVVHRYNFEGIADRLHSECTRSALGFKFSSRLCDALDECYQVWHKVQTGREAPAGRWRPWRQEASPEEVRKREAIRPQENNYDGRNYIAPNN